MEPIDQFERKQEPGALGPIRGAAPGDLDDGDGVVGCIVIDTPPFAPDSNEGAMVQLRRMRRGHGPRGCTTHSVGSVTVNGPAAMLASGTLLTALSHREIWKARLSVSVFRSLQWNVDGGKGVRNLPASVEARASICAQPRDRRAQVGFRGVPEFSHQRVSFERLLHDAPLNPFASSVNEPYLTETGVVCGVHVFFDNGLDLAGRKRMKVERVFYRDAMVLVNSQLPTPNFQAFSSSARC